MHVVIPTYLLFLAWLQGPIPPAEQTTRSTPAVFPADSIPTCGFDDVLRKAEQEHTADYLLQQTLEDQLYRNLTGHHANAGSRSPETFTIPVVVHIIHDNGPENISDAQVLKGIAHLNAAFGNYGYYDQGTGLDSDIRFCLARQDPYGNLTTGITRNASPLTDMIKESQDLQLKNLNRWDPDCYLNIWLVGSITSNSSGPSIAGYATFPGSHGKPYDGIVYEAQYFGSDEQYTALAAHETGHYLGLYHTFEGGCANNNCLIDGDRVCDTPPDQSTAFVPCEIGANTCGTDTDSGFSADMPDMINNYMDYTLPECRNAFTPGQRDRMHFFLTTARSSLLGCASCLDPCPVAIQIALPLSPFAAPVGESTTISAVTNQVTQFQWSVNGQVVSNSPQLNYTFDDLGVYTVVLTGTNNDANCMARDTVVVETYCAALPDADIIESELSIPVGQPITIHSTGADNNNFQWFIDGQPAGFGQNLTHAFNSEGSFQVILEGTSFIPVCKAYDTLTVEVYCDVSINIGAETPVIDEGGSVQFYASGSNLTGVQWYVNGQLVGAGTTFNYTFPVQGFYEVFAVGSSAFCSKRSGSVIIEVQGPCHYGAETGGFIISGFDFAKTVERANQPGFILMLENSIIRLNNQNQIIWAKGSEVFSFLQLAADRNNGGYLGVGYLKGDDDRKYVFKLSETGDLLWSKEIFFHLNFSTNLLLKATRDGNFALLGIYYALPQLYSALMVIDPNGNILINRSFDNVRLFNSLQTQDGGYLLAGTIVVPSGSQELTLIKLDQAGVTQWINYYPSPTASALTVGQAFQLVETPEGDILASIGLSNSNLQCGFVKFSSQGNFIWGKDLSLNEGQVFYNQNYLAGLPGGQNLFVLRAYAADFTNFPLSGSIDKDGNFLWMRRYPFGRDCTHFTQLENNRLAFLLRGALMFTDTLGVPLACDYTDPDYAVMDFSLSTVPTTLLSSMPNTLESSPIELMDISPAIDPLCAASIQGFDAAFQGNEVFACGDSMQVFVRVCNTGNLPLPPETPVSFYDGNPTVSDAGRLTTLNLGALIQPDSCRTLSFGFHPPLPQKIYAMINDDGSLAAPFDPLTDFPVNGQYECDFLNNLDSISLENPQFTAEPPLDLGEDAVICPGDQFLIRPNTHYVAYRWQDGSVDSVFLAQAPGMYYLEVETICGGVFTDTITISNPQEMDLDLGPDQVICQNSVFTFEPGPGFAEYRWQDGTADPTFTASEPGTYWLEATDNCGQLYRDTAVIALDPGFTVELGPDQAICAGDTLSFNITANYSTYHWYPEEAVPCIDCPDVQVAPAASGRLILVASNDLGCLSSDTVYITVQAYQASDTFRICAGQTIDLFGESVGEAGVYSRTYQSVLGCDSTMTYFVELLDTVATSETVTICRGEEATIFGQLQSSPGIYSAVYPTANGCDSTHYVLLEVREPVATSESVHICQGDTAFVFGIPETQSGDYSATFTGANTCDSTHTVTLLVSDTVVTSEDRIICQGETTVIFGQQESEPGDYSAVFPAVSGCDSIHHIRLEVADTVATAETITICRGENADIFGNPTGEPGEYTAYFSTVAGCDSIHRINLVVLDSVATWENLVLCQGETAVIFDQAQTEPGLYSRVFAGANGCDSTHYIDLAFLPLDTGYLSVQLCPGDSVSVFGQVVRISGKFEQWFTSSNGCDSLSVIEVTLHTLPDPEARITSACPGINNGSILLSVTDGEPPYHFKWSNKSEDTPANNQLSPGFYSVSIQDDNGCRIAETYEVSSLPEPEITLQVEDVLCPGDANGLIRVESADPGLKFSLNGQSYHTTPSFENLPAGAYTVHIQFGDKCFTSIDTQLKEPPGLDLHLPEQLVIDPGESVVLEPSGNLDRVEFYQWSPPDGLSCTDCANPVAAPEESTLYTLTIGDEADCEVSANVQVWINPSPELYIPSAFSPNNDQVNDFFKPYADSDRPIRIIRIFDRWGGMVYEEKDRFLSEITGWDGTRNGLQLPSGVYVYYIEAEGGEGHINRYSGDLVLMR